MVGIEVAVVREKQSNPRKTRFVVILKKVFVKSYSFFLIRSASTREPKNHKFQDYVWDGCLDF